MDQEQRQSMELELLSAQVADLRMLRGLVGKRVYVQVRYEVPYSATLNAIGQRFAQFSAINLYKYTNETPAEMANEERPEMMGATIPLLSVNLEVILKIAELPAPEKKNE